MVEQNGGGLNGCWPPAEAPASALLNVHKENHWRHIDNSVNAVSFGFVATAILISMFLAMAIFERFLRPSSSGRSHNASDLEMGFKLGYPSPKMTVYASAVTVLMPGDNIPTFIAHPAPVPCPLEHVNSSPNPTTNSEPNTNSSYSSPNSNSIQEN